MAVYTLATLKLGTLPGLPAFTFPEAALAVMLATMWLIVSKKTVQGGWRGHLFAGLCLANAN